MGLHSFGLRISLLFLSLWSCVAVAQLSVIPAAPRPQETVRVYMPMYNAIVETAISMAGNKVTIALTTQMDEGGFPVPPPTAPVDLPIGAFPTGVYEVEVTATPRGAMDSRSLGTATFSVSPQDRSKPLRNYSDLWWTPDESGWGLNIVQHPSGVIFATWFTYDPDGTPAWYVVPSGEWNAVAIGDIGVLYKYRGPVYRTSGPPVADTFDPARVTRTLVGEALFQFLAYDFLRAQLTVDGRTVTKDLQRQGF
jgi:hypothetical protein